MAAKSAKSSSVRFGGYMYSTLDFIDPYSTDMGTQSVALPLPAQWEVAPNDPTIAKNVIAPHSWGTHRLVLSDGSAYDVKGYGKPGVQAESPVSSRRPFTKEDTYKPWGASYRVLIRCCECPEDTFLSSILSGMWDQKRFTDCTMVCAGEEVTCHRAVLAQISPVFDRMFSSEMREAKEQRIEIVDAKFSTVLSMLNFAYTKRLDVETDDVMELLCLAEKYQFMPLVVSCSDKAFASITHENVASIVKSCRFFEERPETRSRWDELMEKVRDDRELLSAVMKGF